MKNTARLVVMDSVWGHMGKLDFLPCLPIEIPLFIFFIIVYISSRRRIQQTRYRFHGSGNQEILGGVNCKRS